MRLLEAVEALAIISGTANRLESSDRIRVNAALDNAGFDGDRSFQTVGQSLSAINHVLERHGLHIEADTVHSRVASGQRTFHIVASGTRVENSILRVGWYQHPSGNYEVTAYLS